MAALHLRKRTDNVLIKFFDGLSVQEAI